MMHALGFALVVTYLVIAYLMGRVDGASARRRHYAKYPIVKPRLILWTLLVLPSIASAQGMVPVTGWRSAVPLQQPGDL